MTTCKNSSLLQFRIASLVMAVGLLAASCTQDGTPKSTLNDKAILPDGIALTQINTGAVNVTDPSQIAPVSPTTPVAAQQPLPKEEVVVPPKDAKWTIVGTVVGGPGHSIRARQFRDQLAASTNSSKWYVVHEEDKSTLYYGFYRTIERGTKEGEAAQADRKLIAALPNSNGDMPMRLCTFMRIDRAGPDAPGEWDLNSYVRNPKQYWSLQIAAYTADASDDQGHDRKWAAVETVKAMRAEGIPAYFSHSETVSSVFIGIFPADAVKRQSGGNDRGNADAANPEQSIMVLTEPMPAGLIPKDPEGRSMKTVVPRVEILDRELYGWMMKYPSHAVNSIEHLHEVIDPKTGQNLQVAEPSFLVLLPEQKQLDMAQAPRRPVDTSSLMNLPPALLQIDTPLQPGAGKLREIGQ